MRTPESYEILSRFKFAVSVFLLVIKGGPLFFFFFSYQRHTTHIAPLAEKNALPPMAMPSFASADPVNVASLVMMIFFLHRV